MKNTLYKIYYGKELVYFGRTHQDLQDRIRAHMFNSQEKASRIKKLDISLVSKIEKTECQTEADMYLYEIYYINKYKPRFNTDDKSPEILTVSLPELKFEEWTSPLWESWKDKIKESEKKKESDFTFKKRTTAKKEQIDAMLEQGEISKGEYDELLEGINNALLKKKYENREISLVEYLEQSGKTRL